jgi:hypothetical protein
MNDLATCPTQIVKPKPFAGLQLKVKKNSPEILVGMGIVGVVTSTVLACKATLKAPAVMEEARQKFSDIRDASDLAIMQSEAGEDVSYTEMDRRQDIVKASAQTSLDFIKLYGVPVVLMGVSIFAITKGHGITMKRNTALSSAFAAVSSGYNAYRQRVAEQLGIEAEQDLYYGRKTETIENEKGKKEKVTVITAPNDPSVYARFFDDASPEWQPSPELNLTFLRCQQNYANDKLRINKHLFLNEVYDMLGLPRSQAGAIVGWVIKSDGDNYVDFGLYDGDTRERRMFVNGAEANFLLDFNVDGVIWDSL